MTMKTLYKIFALIVILGLWSCEKNDPLADQGDLTGIIVPFNLLAQMPDAAAGDTVRLRTVTWAIDDDIESVSFYHMGFKLREYEVKMAVQISSGSTVELATLFKEDSVKFASTLVASYPEQGSTLNDYYQTYENAYVVVHNFLVPQQYRLSKEKNEELILAMKDGVYQAVVEQFSNLFTRPVMVAVFPDINAFSPTYFVIDDEGFYTGEITPAAKQYIVKNLDRETMNEFLKDATVADNTRVTIESVTTLEVTGAHTTSARTFRAL